MTDKFNFLSRSSLIRLLKHYGLYAKPDCSLEDLHSMVLRCFEKSSTSEESTIQSFISKCNSCIDNNDASNFHKLKKKRKLLTNKNEPARSGEQVAAKVIRSNEDGSWILGNVIDFDANTQTYEVQDEDDIDRLITLPLCDVRRLDDTAIHLRKNDKVLAVFPDTTSFYKAVVVKNPKVPNQSSNWDVIIRFDDDEDDSGVAPPRRVPARFVIPRPEPEDDD